MDLHCAVRTLKRWRAVALGYAPERRLVRNSLVLFSSGDAGGGGAAARSPP